jgi:hypothetical protein
MGDLNGNYLLWLPLVTLEWLSMTMPKKCSLYDMKSVALYGLILKKIPNLESEDTWF